MNVAEYSLGRCPKCDSLGAFVTVFVSDTTDNTRNAILRTIIIHEGCGLKITSEHTLKYWELNKMGFYDKYKNEVKDDAG